MKTKFLWIEDNARTDLRYMIAPAFMSGRYDPVVATDVAEGLYQLRHTEFQAVIVDIRLLPGDDPEWEDLYLRLGGTKSTARLGLHLLYSLFGPRLDDIKLKGLPPWVTKPENRHRFGVLTVEDIDPNRDLGQALESFDINTREQKTASTPNTILLHMVDRIVGPPADV